MTPDKPIANVIKIIVPNANPLSVLLDIRSMQISTMRQRQFRLDLHASAWFNDYCDGYLWAKLIIHNRFVRNANTLYTTRVMIVYAWTAINCSVYDPSVSGFFC